MKIEELKSTRLEENPRYQAAMRTCDRSGSAFEVEAPAAHGWTWAIIAILAVAGLAVLGLVRS